MTVVTVYATLCLILAAVSKSSSNEVEPPTLDLLVLAPFPPEGETPSSTEFYAGGPLLLPAVDLAVQHINDNQSVLPGYQLANVTVRNSGCVDEFTTLVSFTKNVFSIRNQVNFVGVIGPACSQSAVTLASLVKKGRGSLLMIGAATSPALALSAKYDTTFRTVQSALAYVDVFLSLMNENNWERIGVLYDSERFYFYSIFDEFAARMNSTERLNFSSGITHTFFPTDVVLQGEEIRIIFVLAGGFLSRQLVCLAYNSNIMYPRVQWIFSDKRKEHFLAVNFTYDGEYYNCTQEQMDLALKGAIFANYKLEREISDDTITVSGLTYREYLEQYDSRRAADRLVGADWRPDNYSNAYYDAVWSMALALNGSIPWFEEHNISLTDYRYGNVNATEEVQDNLLKLKFEGMTGPIHFSNTTRDTQTTIELFQMQCTQSGSDETCEEVYIGNYSRSSLSLIGIGEFINDSFEEVPVSFLPLGVGIFTFIITMSLAVTTLLFQLVYISYHNYQRIKASSPHLMHLMFSGCYLIIVGQIAILVLVSSPIPSDIHPFFHSLLCATEWWCFPMGIALIFGTICARTWRVYQIFTSLRKDLKYVSDYWLICFVVFLLALFIAFNLVVHIADPCILQIQSKVYDGDKSFLVRRGCRCLYSDYWLVILLLFVYFILLCCAVLSFLTRHVHRSDYKTTRGVNILVYIISFIFFFHITFQIVVGRSFSSVVVHYISQVLLIVFCQLFIFIPPILPRHTLNFDTKQFVFKSVRKSNNN